mgnify:CR=1 FL=1
MGVEAIAALVRGLALANALAAAAEGVDVISGAFLGIGERSGNMGEMMEFRS